MSGFLRTGGCTGCKLLLYYIESLRSSRRRLAPVNFRPAGAQIMDEQLSRIRAKLNSTGRILTPPLTDREVVLFEQLHGIALPEEYRLFLTHLGNGGVGPPAYGLLPLGKPASDMLPDERTLWTDLPYIQKPFPFTKYWVWEDGETSAEGSDEQVAYGSLLLGNDGCGMYWHLIVNGPERGIPWMLCGEGIQPVSPRRGFLQWYEDWLDGRDSFYGYPGTGA